jgi:H+/Cl- antiporter ClcA
LVPVALQAHDPQHPNPGELNMILTFILLLIIAVFFGTYIWWYVFCDDFDRSKLSDGQYAALIGAGIAALVATITLAVRALVF